jgi:hypothetical protein
MNSHFNTAWKRTSFLCRQCRRHMGCVTLKEGDCVILESTKLLSKGRQSPTYLTKPLQSSLTINTHLGDFKGSDIIGKRVRDTVTTSNGSVFRVMEASLADYINLTPRKVTPVRIMQFREGKETVSNVFLDIPTRCESNCQYPRY